MVLRTILKICQGATVPIRNFPDHWEMKQKDVLYVPVSYETSRVNGGPAESVGKGPSLARVSKEEVARSN